MKVVAGPALVALVLALPTTARALRELAETFGNAPVANQRGWAEGVVDVVNLQSRVYWYLVSGPRPSDRNDYFFYRGNADALNEALRKYALVKGGARRLILLPAPGQTQSLRGKPVAFDWRFHVSTGTGQAGTKGGHAVMTVYVNAARPPRPSEAQRKRIGQWLRDLDSATFRIREKARKELQTLGSAARPFLRAALKTRPTLEARRQIEALLDRLRDLDVSALEVPKGVAVIGVDDLLATYLQGLKDADLDVCRVADRQLSLLASCSDQVVPALAELLRKGRHAYVRHWAAAALARVGVKARSALPALKAGLDDPDRNFRRTFQAAIDQINKARDRPEPEEVVKKRRAILKDIQEFKKAAGGK
jgi:hypothetical protein